MSDLIDRQAAIDEIENYEATAPDYMQGWAVKLIEAIKGDIRVLISELPSAQPDIILCPNCRYNDGTAYCELHYRDVKAKDFCSWAERRE